MMGWRHNRRLWTDARFELRPASLSQVDPSLLSGPTRPAEENGKPRSGKEPNPRGPHHTPKPSSSPTPLSQFDEETTRRVTGRRNRRPKPISALPGEPPPEVGRSRVIQRTAIRFSRAPHPRASPHATRVIAISSTYRRPAAERATTNS